MAMENGDFPNINLRSEFMFDGMAIRTKVIKIFKCRWKVVSNNLIRKKLYD